MSDILLDTLLKEGRELVLVLGPDGQIREISESFATLLGQPRGALLGQPLERLLDPDRRPAEGVLDLLRTRQGQRAEVCVRGQRPGLRWVDLRTARVSADGVVLLGRDTTGARVARTSQVQLSALAQQLPGVLWTVDRSMTVTSVTGGGLVVRNRSAESLLGTTLYEYVGSEDPAVPPVAAHLRALEGHSGHYEFEREGRTFHARVDPLRASDGSIQGAVGLALEVTESRDLEERLRLAQREQTLGRLAGSMAHEFNNLLTIIAAHAALLEDQLATEGAAEDLGAVVEAASKGRLLTSRLLSFTSRQIQTPERVRVDRLLGELEPMLAAIVGERRRLALELDPGVGWIRIDPALLEQVVLNLVDNARQATDEGARITVRASARASEREPGGWVEISVRDEGYGMTESVRSRACEPFFTTKPQGQGSGLGLTTALAVVSEAEGSLTIDSALGGGTTVRIRFPRSKAPSGSFVKPKVGAAISETILLVEDQLGVRRAARRILRRAGYQVFEAAHAEDALALATAYPGRLDVLLTDVVMPGMSGPQLAEKILEHRPDTKVLYMSGYAEDVDEVRAAIERGQTFLPKPFTPERLLTRLREALGEGVDLEDGVAEER
ncbi:MAG: response regulator [Sandaracinaceae bacterium]|nr:MAG: response regulator [Sandaracinaceae bacterium]